MHSSTPSFLSGKGSCHLQVIGMHFMNPPPIMRLVEIVRGADTSDASFSATKSLAERSLEEYILFWFELVSYIFVTCGCPLSLSLNDFIYLHICVLHFGNLLLHKGVLYFTQACHLLVPLEFSGLAKQLFALRIILVSL